MLQRGEQNDAEHAQAKKPTGQAIQPNAAHACPFPNHGHSEKRNDDIERRGAKPSRADSNGHQDHG